MDKIICFGEIMMRLNPEGYLRFLQAGRYEASFAGGEANVAVSLAHFGRMPAYVTKLPSNDIGQCAVNELRHYGVDTSLIVRGGPRVGIYFVEKGASQRGSKVIYDRAGSAVALAARGDFHWETILDGVSWFHFTGITPALGGELPAICLDALECCKAKGVKVSCDLNYRGKLWTREKAREVMSGLVPYVDVCIANEEDAADVFGIHAADSDVQGGVIHREGYLSVAKQLQERFGCPAVAITLRGSISANDNDWAGMLFTGGKAYYSKSYRIHIVDRVGGGDAFGGGLIHALLNGWDAQEAIEFAVAASCLKQTVEHDFNMATEQEVLALAGGNASGRVQR
jgi:2-dehydro-3-deoxygluconokinase